MTLTDQFTKTTILDVPATYKGFSVFYMGDKAGIHFDYTKPRQGVSERHEKYKTITTAIQIPGETYSLGSLSRKLEEMESSAASNAQDVLALHQGLAALQKFIEENGEDNPFEGDAGAEWKEFRPTAP